MNIDVGASDVSSIIRSLERDVLSRENIGKKLVFIDELGKAFPQADDSVHPAIHHALFSMARDINPFVRQRALVVLARSAPVPPETILLGLARGVKERRDVGEVDPRVGTFGMCLEDPVPEVRAMAIKAMTVPILMSGDTGQSKNVMAVIAQMINDGAVMVRAAAIEALIRVSRIINRLIPLEDQQIRLLLPMLTASDASVHDRREIISFFSQVRTATYEQTIRIFEDLAASGKRNLEDKEQLIASAHAFGQNNPQFMRLVAANYLKSMKKKKWNLASLDITISVIAILAARRRMSFPVSDEVAKIAHRMVPVLESLDRARESESDSRNTFVNLNELEEEVRKSPAHENRVMLENRTLRDARDYVMGADVPERFNIIESNETKGLVSVAKYVATVIAPESNSKFDPYPYDPSSWFFLRRPIAGQVTPVPEPGDAIVVAIEIPLLHMDSAETAYVFEAPISENGSFSINPSLRMPSILPVFPVELSVMLVSSENVRVRISESVEIWWKDSTKNV